MEIPKRKEEESSESNGNDKSKKQKTNSELTIYNDNKDSKAVSFSAIPRTSKLNAPIMVLTGHGAEVYGTRFSPSGEKIASCSFDKTICLWDVYGECKNTHLLKGHSNAVLQVEWLLDGKNLVSGSADKTAAIWDAETGTRIRKYKHSAIVNCVAPNKKGNIFATGSDDNVLKLWDSRSKKSIGTYKQELPVLTCCFSGAGDQIFFGGVDNTISVFEVKKEKTSFTLEGHTDTITNVRLSPDGSYLLSNSMDNSVRIWDVRPFVIGSRCQKVLQGAVHNFEKNLIRCAWSTDSNRVAVGSADRNVYVWDATTRKLLFKLPGHKGTVNDVDFHPKEPIIASCSNDKTVYLGELPN